LGRFVGRDPIGYVDGPSLYGYVSGAPLTVRDPSGRIDEAGCVMLGIDPAGGGDFPWPDVVFWGRTDPGAGWVDIRGKLKEFDPVRVKAGKFNVSLYAEKDIVAAYGAKITFTPNGLTDRCCDEIRFVQTARVTARATSGRYVPVNWDGMRDISGLSQQISTVMVRTGPSAGWFLDRTVVKYDPSVFWDSDDRAVRSWWDGSAAETVIGGTPESLAATMYDFPDAGSLSPHKEMAFVTCAYCGSGRYRGRWLGCVEWGLKSAPHKGIFGSWWTGTWGRVNRQGLNSPPPQFVDALTQYLSVYPDESIAVPARP
jgi:hypothetical protein